jgi:hypothetical protein
MRRVSLVFGTMLTCALASGTALAADQPTPATAPPAAQPLDPSQKMICKSEKETGSLIKAKKTCHTKAQWDYILDINSKFANDFVDNNRNKPGGN